MDQIPRRDVERSFRKFNDIVDDLFSAKYQTWGDTFSHLINHCEVDPIMKLITEGLRLNKSIDVNSWYEEATKNGYNHGHYKLPYDIEELMPLLYQFFLKVNSEEHTLKKFCMCVYAVTKYQEMVEVFNQEIVLKFTREMSYRLNEILEDAGTENTVARENIIIFQHYDHSTTIHGNIHGRNVALSNSTISEAIAVFNSKEDLVKALKLLTGLLQDLNENNRNIVLKAIEVLVSSIELGHFVDTEISDAVVTICNASPMLESNFKRICTNIGTELLTSPIFQMIKKASGTL